MNSGPEQGVARAVVEGALSARTIRALEGSRAEETVRKYDTAWRQFVGWCTAHRLKSLPAAEETVMEYLAERGEQGWVKSTLDLDLAAVRYYHRAHGERVPDTAGVRAVIRYYAKARGKAGYKPQKAAPAVPEVLIKMVGTCDLETPRGLRDRCLLTLGEFMFGRRSEIVCLNIHSVEFVPDGLDVYLPYSKTDQDAEGTQIAIAYGQRRETCPVRATRDWLACLQRQGIERGPLFRPINKAGVIAREGHTGGGGSSRLHPGSVNTIIKDTAREAGLPNWQDFRGHSVRRGGATAAARAGKSAKAIRRQGRWSERSTVADLYIEDEGRWKDNPMIGVGL